MRFSWKHALLAAPLAVFLFAVGVRAGDDHAGHGHAEHAKASLLADAPENAEIGKLAPDFVLTDTEGNEHHLAHYVDQGYTVVLEWFNPDCPFVKKHHLHNKSMAGTYQTFADEKVVWLAVNSAAPGLQGYGVDYNKKAMKEYSIEYPMLLDETGVVGKAYGAKTTPQIYVIHEGVLMFNGPLDEVAKPGKLGEKNYVKEVLEGCLAGKDVEPAQIKSYGCNVKYAS